MDFIFGVFECKFNVDCTTLENSHFDSFMGIDNETQRMLNIGKSGKMIYGSVSVSKWGPIGHEDKFNVTSHLHAGVIKLQTARLI